MSIIQFHTEPVGARTNFNHEVRRAVYRSLPLNGRQVVVPFLRNPGSIGNALRPAGQTEPHG